jgi:hypothetical protein
MVIPVLLYGMAVSVYRLHSMNRKSNIVGYENSNKPQYLTFSEYPILIQEEDYYIKDLNKDNYIFLYK